MSTNEPRLSRPQTPPGYGIAETITSAPEISWERARERLEGARNYWICSVGTGRPHAMPVWGLWLEDAFYFSTARDSRKGRNLAANPAVSVHLESGDDVVILEGEIEVLADAEALARFVDAYDVKYQVRPDADDPANAVYVLRPRVAFTWLERNYPDSAARWQFERA